MLRPKVKSHQRNKQERRRKSHKAVKIKVPICTGKWRLLDMVTSPPSLSSCIKLFVAEQRAHFNREPPREAWSQPAVCDVSSWPHRILVEQGGQDVSCLLWKRLWCTNPCTAHQSWEPLQCPEQLSEGGWMVLISWERWQHLQGGADQRLCRSGLLSIPAAPMTEILLPLGSELWIFPFNPVCSTDNIR